MDPFQQAAENFEASQAGNDGGSSQEVQGQSSDQAPELKSVSSEASDHATRQAEQAVLDLSKHDKFTIAGRELTRDQLSKILEQEKKFSSMNKDYTQKTQRLSEERKAFEGEQKFYQHLPYDLLALRQDPTRINEFLQAYPAKFHGYAEQILRQASSQVQAGQNPNAPGVNQGHQPDVQILSRLQQVETFLNEQKTAQRESEIQGILAELDKKYPDAADFREVILGRAFEAHNQNTELTKEAWENIYQQVDKDVAQKVKAKYGSMVKQQTEANKKAKDVSAGGGTVGRAPQKFKKWADIDKAALAAVDNNQF